MKHWDSLSALCQQWLSLHFGCCVCQPAFTSAGSMDVDGVA